MILQTEQRVIQKDEDRSAARRFIYEKEELELRVAELREQQERLATDMESYQ